MIAIKNVNKYFNKRKSNEIHVINNTSLEFPANGLVCLLGASGSGKTTLLNVVGGLDKIDNGEIVFKDYSIKKYKSSQWDFIRNRHFGYIFQNYILLPDLTVYQNLELVLKILNLDKDEIDQRIEYALDAVGMLKFKKRKPTQLSGGQQQRIAIARALVKSPDVVIADEPTGNLDERNTTQIMSIIKKISKECLVILVTHERRLAEFYGDRIIEIADGKVINDIAVTSTGEFKEVDNNNIYLQEYQKEEAISEDLNIKYFYKDIKEKLDLNVIFQDNTFYIHSPVENIKIKFLDKSNEIKVIDSKKPVISQEQIDEFEYHIPKIEHKSTKNESVIKFKDTLKMAFRHLGGLRRRQKLLFAIMFLSTIMITIGFINLFSSQHVDEDDFLYFNRNLVVTDLNYETLSDNLGPDDKILYKPEEGRVTMLNNGFFDQSMNNITITDYNSRTVYTNSIIPLEYIESPNLVIGKLPTAYGEAVIDKKLVDRFLKLPSMSSAGIKHNEQFLDLTFEMFNHGMGPDFDAFKIVGIIDNNNPNFYIREIDYITAFIPRGTSFNDSAIVGIDDIGSSYYSKISETGLNIFEMEQISELGPNQAIVDSIFFENFINNSGSNKITISTDRVIEVIGFVTSSNFKYKYSGVIYLNDEYIYDFYDEFLEKMYSKNTMLVYAKNPKEFIDKFKDSPSTVELLYDQEYEALKLQVINIDLFISSLVVLGASLVFLFFLMRSSMMSRIYQIGVYRALGIGKSNIYRIFFTEILIITLITSIIGIFMVSVVVNKVNEIAELIYYPWFIAPISLLFITIVNAIVGLLPVNTLLRLTPSQILSKYDI